jgi:hypothetical protein
VVSFLARGDVQTFQFESHLSFKSMFRIIDYKVTIVHSQKNKKQDHGYLQEYCVKTVAVRDCPRISSDTNPCPFLRTVQAASVGRLEKIMTISQSSRWDQSSIDLLALWL